MCSPDIGCITTLLTLQSPTWKWPNLLNFATCGSWVSKLAKSPCWCRSSWWNMPAKMYCHWQPSHPPLHRTASLHLKCSLLIFETWQLDQQQELLQNLLSFCATAVTVQSALLASILAGTASCNFLMVSFRFCKIIQNVTLITKPLLWLNYIQENEHIMLLNTGYDDENGRFSNGREGMIQLH